MTKNIKGELHHWWPKSLSQFWANEAGAVTWVAPDGTEKQSKYSTWGAIRNGHTVNFTPDWRFSFEGSFGASDSNFPHVVAELLQIDSDFTREHMPLAQRLHPVSVADHILGNLRECLASLIVRVPENRSRAIRTVEFYRGEINDLRERDNLIAINLRGQLRGTIDALRGGKFIVVFSPDKEFIFGDGFYHNITPGFSASTGVKLAVPLTPHMAVIFSRPMSYVTLPNAFTLRIGPEETREFNELIQIYSKEMIFYRSERPELLSCFTRGEHLRLKHSRLPWLQDLIDAAADYGHSKFKQNLFGVHRW